MGLLQKLCFASIIVSKVGLTCSAEDLRNYHLPGDSGNELSRQYGDLLEARSVFESSEAARFDLVVEAFFVFSPRDAIFRKIVEEREKFAGDSFYKGNDSVRSEYENYLASLRQASNTKKLEAFISFGTGFFTADRKLRMEMEAKALAAASEQGAASVDFDARQFQSLMDFFQRAEKAWNPAAPNFGLSEKDFLALAIYADNFRSK